MAYSIQSLNQAISLKLTDLDQATGLHKALFACTQISGTVGLVGGVLIAPLALEVGIIAGGAGLTMYALSQLIQSKRIGHFLPIPLVPLSGQQIGYGVSKAVSLVMGGTPPDAPTPVKLLPSDWLPEKEQRVSYLLTHCPDLIVTAAHNAQDGISLAAIVDSAVRASEYAITDEQLSNPITARKLAPQVRQVLQGDTSSLEAQQAKAIQGEYQRAIAAHEAGELSAGELEGLRQQVEELAPGAIEAKAVTVLEPAQESAPVSTAAPGAPVKSATASTAFEAITSQPGQSFFFLGGQRSGKTYLATVAAQNSKRANNEIYYINLSGWAQEDDTYSSVARMACMGDLCALNEEQAGELVNDARKVLEAFFNSSKPSTLIIDEFVEMGLKANLHAGLLSEFLNRLAFIASRYCNTGKKRKKTVYAMGPIFRADAMTDAAKLTVKIMALVLPAIAPGKSVWVDDEAITFDETALSHARNNWGAIPDPPSTLGVDRIAFIGGQWLPVGDMPCIKPLAAASKPMPSNATAQHPKTYGASPFPQSNSQAKEKPAWYTYCDEIAESDPVAAAVLRWCSTTTKERFSPRDFNNDKKNRGVAKTPEVRDVMQALAADGWLADAGDGCFEVTPD